MTPGQHEPGLYDVEQIRAHEQALFAAGVDPDGLMYRAGEAAFAALRRHWPEARQITVLIGPGQNGGDGVVLATLAYAAGMAVELISWQPTPSFSGSAAVFWSRWVESGGAPVMRVDHAAFDSAEVIVDAAFGIGLNRPVEGAAAELLRAVNERRQAGAAVLAIDIPSGLMADSGDAGAAVIEADVTVTMLALKLGLVTGMGPGVTGRIELATLGQPAPVPPPIARLLYWPQPLPPRPRGSHKGAFGSLLVLAGNRGMSGAARMAAEAALRIGTGKVTVATHPDHAAMLNAGRPELMVHAVSDDRSLLRLMSGVDAMVVGPGLGRDGWALQLGRAAFKFEGAMVVDADGLRLLGRESRRGLPTVITPHPGEAAELLDGATAEIQRDRVSAALQLVDRFGALTLLKGAGSVIASPEPADDSADGSGGADDPRLFVCGRGHPALATAGTGDVLAGLVGGLLAQGLTPERALKQAVCWHAVAGELEADQCGGHGMAASDLLVPVRALANGQQATLTHQDRLARRHDFDAAVR